MKPPAVWRRARHAVFPAPPRSLRPRGLRRPARQPDLTFTWPAALEFFEEAETGFQQTRHPALQENVELAKYLVPLARTFFRQLRHVLQFPGDEEGTRLA